ncbi:MAG: lysyl oxidase family protein [Solirubrobacteraceae bacterium]
MTRRLHIVLLLAVLVGGTAAASSAAGELRISLPENPALIAPAPAPIPPPPVTPPPVTPVPIPPVPIPPPDPCADPLQRCPDLVLGAPGDLRIVRSRSGRLRLGSRNMLINRGTGPLYLLGRRDKRRTMTVSQRVYARSGAHTDHPLVNARFDFWLIPGQGRYWKLRDALRFELWTARGPTKRFVKSAAKTRFCMRDLTEVPGLHGPRSRRFPGCSQSSRAKAVRMGISVGWAESYPPFYYEQYVDITGLRGCYSLRHVADPRRRIHESDESNNTSQRRIRLGGARVRRC